MPFSKGIYEYRGNTFRNIYGYDKPTPCICEPTIDPTIALQTLLDFILYFRDTIDNFYVHENINAPFVTSVNIRGMMTFALFARVTWGKLYGKSGAVFNPLSLTDINALKDIYLSHNRDWRTDRQLLHLSLSMAAL